MRVSQRGRDRIKKHEAFREFAYPDPESDLARATRGRRWGLLPAREILATLRPDVQQLSGHPWTCGYGATRGVTMDTRWSRAQAETELGRDLADFELGVISACTRRPNQNQFDAMVSLAYNIGLGWRGSTKPKGAKDGFRQSTVLRAHNRGDFAAAARAFALWNKANGRENAGLTARRAAEAALYAEAIPDDISDGQLGIDEAMPQNVDAESAPAQSTINRASVVAGGTAAVATVAELTRTVADVKASVDGLGPWVVPLLLIAVVGLCGYIVWQRLQQRKGGWA